MSERDGPTQHRIAVYGKGGVGKSVVATNLSVCFARKGVTVLHVGCDPKHDSAIRLVGDDVEIRTMLDVFATDESSISPDRALIMARHGIHCLEAGGPEPGLGCGGRGVARTLEFLEDYDVLTTGGYGAVIFDVLGDVVCGGFAAPLRLGFAEKVLIVVSEEPMALFAANNIAKAILTYHRNGVVLAGLVANLREAAADRALLEAFARRLSTRILAFIPRDSAVLDAERRRRTVVESAPKSPSAKAIQGLTEILLDPQAAIDTMPTPMKDAEFFRFIAG